jgi:hypothetical protein
MSKPKVFASPAFLKIMDKDVYGLFRSIIVEEFNETTGKTVREKVKDVGPISLLRELRKGEDKKVVLRTHHPVDNRELSLVELE